MKVHIGVDADTGLVHRMRATAANVHNITEAHNLLHGLLHGGETKVWYDAGYRRWISGSAQAGGKLDAGG